MKSAILLLAALVLLLGGARRSQAGFINNGTGLSNPTRTITFDEHVLADGASVTTEYSDLGVTFTPNLYFSQVPHSGTIISGNHLVNVTFVEGVATYVNPFTVHFTQQVTDAAFGFAGDGTPYSFLATLNGVTVDSGSANVSEGSFIGFTGETFDTIVVSQNGVGGGPSNLLDNIQFNAQTVTTTPEPSALTLLGIGCASLLGYAWRRRQAALAAA